jgi:hypothetical protein
MAAARCVSCGAPLTAGGQLCIRCGTENPGTPSTGPSGGEPRPAPPPEPRMGFRHPRDNGSTWLRVVVLLVALFVAVSFSAYLYYYLIGR